MRLLSQYRAEERVKRQLIEAILFERLLPFEVVEKHQTTQFLIKGTTHTFQCFGSMSAFQRFRVEEGSIGKINENGQLEKISLYTLVAALTEDESIQTTLLEELQQTIRLSDWNEKNVPMLPSRRDLPYEELESAITEGHPYHPCFKARTGFTLEDHRNYGPEANYSFPLCWLALERTNVRAAFPIEEVEFWKQELGDDIYEILLSRLREQGGSFSSYTLLPVHPWQWERHIKEQAAAPSILYLGHLGDSYRATQSVRTLWNETDPRKAHLKLAMNMVNTSSLRIMENHSVCTAPEISAWLRRVQQSDSYLMSSVVLLQEYAGMIFNSTHLKIEGQLAVIWRESVRSVLKEAEDAVPFNALSLIEQDNRPFIDDWLQKYGVEKWLERFLEVAVLPVWHLFIAHGIGVEAHAQNMVLVHKDGWPIRIILRDFHESVEFTESYLANPSLLPKFELLHPDYKHAPCDTFYWMSSVEAVRELVMDTLFVFHLSELSHMLHLEYHYSEDSFWKKVQDTIMKHLHAFPELVERHRVVQSDHPKIAVESLFTKKIKKTKSEYRHYIPNSMVTK